MLEFNARQNFTYFGLSLAQNSFINIFMILP